MTRASVRCLIIAFFATAMPSAAHAQLSRLDISVGAGRARHKPGIRPNVPTMEVEVAMWLSQTWGLSWEMDHGLGSDHFDVGPSFPQNAGDRKVIESKRLVLTRVLVDYRRNWGRFGIVVGGGLGGGHHEVTELLAETLSTVRTVQSREGWGTVSCEALVSMRVLSHLSVRGGLIADLAEDATYYQPTARILVGF